MSKQTKVTRQLNISRLYPNDEQSHVCKILGCCLLSITSTRPAKTKRYKDGESHLST